jgi:hypothetical protein
MRTILRRGRIQQTVLGRGQHRLHLRTRNDFVGMERRYWPEFAVPIEARDLM